MKWEKLYFVLFLCVVISGNSQAVESFGIVGGVNISSWSTDAGNQNPVPRNDLSIGGYTSFKLSNSTEILLEGLYSRKHGDLDLTIESAYPSSPRTAQYLTDFEYLEFPLLLKFGKRFTEKTAAYLMAGPVVSFELNANYEVIFEEGVQFTGESSGEAPGIPSRDIGVLVGVGIETRVLGRTAGFSARYSWGMREVVEHFGGPKNRAIILLFSVGL